ncbi:YndM family protein [Bacillus shivajii]|uniref:YndM family protein n=1 Tax=Bacillus shivajii TaxID=1983719 RepID=UPI001CFB82B5|nr:YndM family protein [Bacillus shivajii]UCZ51509.1 YndM family protein [Bacillus shivajii]
MKHFNILLFKFIVSLAVFWISLGLFFGGTFVEIISFSLLVTVISYFIGDLMILPQIGKTNAVVVDFFLTYTLVFLFGGIFFHSYLMIGWGSIISASLIAGSELFIHAYIMKNVKHTSRAKQRNFKPNFAFEFAEENEPDPNKDK